jgi:hypothetical protein
MLTYLPPGYLPPGYLSTGYLPETAEPSVPSNIFAAIRQRFLDSPELVAACPGGLWENDLVPEKDDAGNPWPYPAASLFDLSGARGDRNTLGFSTRDKRVQVTFLVAGADPGAAGQDLMELWTDAFESRPGRPRMLYVRGYEVNCQVTNDYFAKTEDLALGGGYIHQQILEMRCLIGRNP